MMASIHRVASRYLNASSLFKGDTYYPIEIYRVGDRVSPRGDAGYATQKEIADGAKEYKKYVRDAQAELRRYEAAVKAGEGPEYEKLLGLFKTPEGVKEFVADYSVKVKVMPKAKTFADLLATGIAPYKGPASDGTRVILLGRRGAQDAWRRRFQIDQMEKGSGPKTIKAIRALVDMGVKLSDRPTFGQGVVQTMKAIDAAKRKRRALVNDAQNAKDKLRDQFRDKIEDAIKGIEKRYPEADGALLRNLDWSAVHKALGL